MLAVLCAAAMEESLFELPFISQLFILVVELPHPVHFSIFPLAYIRLAVDVLVHSFAVPCLLSLVDAVSADCLAEIAADVFIT